MSIRRSEATIWGWSHGSYHERRSTAGVGVTATVGKVKYVERTLSVAAFGHAATVKSASLLTPIPHGDVRQHGTGGQTDAALHARLSKPGRIWFVLFSGHCVAVAVMTSIL